MKFFFRRQFLHGIFLLCLRVYIACFYHFSILFVRSFIMMFYFMCPRLMCASYVCNPKMVINLLKTNFKENAPKTRSKCVLLRMCNEHSDPSIQFQILAPRQFHGQFRNCTFKQMICFARSVFRCCCFQIENLSTSMFGIWYHIHKCAITIARACHSIFFFTI